MKTIGHVMIFCYYVNNFILLNTVLSQHSDEVTLSGKNIYFTSWLFNQNTIRPDVCMLSAVFENVSSQH
jgi:hypothetical protein